MTDDKKPDISIVPKQKVFPFAQRKPTVTDACNALYTALREDGADAVAIVAVYPDGDAEIARTSLREDKHLPVIALVGALSVAAHDIRDEAVTTEVPEQ